MRAYTLHLATGAGPRDARAIETARIVPDGFSWGAFLFTALWCFRHRLVLAGLLVVLAFAALAGLAYVLNLAPPLAGLAALLLALLVGLEGSSLRRWTYARGGRPAIDVLTAGNADEAEAKFLVRALAGETAATGGEGTRMGTLPLARASDDAVFGLFPEAEGPR